MNAVSSRYVGLLYAAPALLFVLVFLVYPLGQLFYTSLTSASLLGGGEFVGFRNYVTRLERPAVLDVAALHAEIHALHHADPDGPRLPPRAAHRRQHPPQAADPRRDLPAGRDRARGLEPALVLALRPAGRPVQQVAGRRRHARPADHLVHQADPGALGGHHLDHLEGGRLRHDPVRREHPVDRQRDHRGRADRRRQLLAAGAADHPAAQLPHDPARDADQRHRLDAGLRPVQHHDRRQSARADVHLGLLDLSELIRLLQTGLRLGAVGDPDADHLRLRRGADHPHAARTEA